MAYLLDTNAVIALLNNSSSKLGQRVRAENPRDIAISVIVAHELFYGAFKSGRPSHNTALIDALQFEVIEFDKEDARIAGEVRARLKVAGTPIGPFDVLIAGQALSRNLILITHNTREFGRKPKLKMEDWAA
jgi:tRNA(fMet)-specific endonuclease VapC